MPSLFQKQQDTVQEKIATFAKIKNFSLFFSISLVYFCHSTPFNSKYHAHDISQFAELKSSLEKLGTKEV